MGDNFVDITDGENYLSRTRINRRVFTLTGNAPSTTAFINGKVSKIIIDASRSSYLPGSGNIGTFKVQMDLEEDGGTELLCFDEITTLNFSGTGNDQVSYLECTPGSNKGTATSKNALALSVSAPTTATSGAGLINESSAWNGHLVGNVRMTVGAAEPNLLAPTAEIRIILIME